MTISPETELRTEFLDYLFNKEQGYVCIATSKPNDRQTFKQVFFRWPQQTSELSAYVDQMVTSHNVWFCVNLLKKAERKKEQCLPTNLVWADLDTCEPGQVEPKPQCIIESSPGRYQAIWRLDNVVDPYVAESFSKKIAYRYVTNGADPSGWDLTQLLRLPLTTNFKYDKGTLDDIPSVKLRQAKTTLCPVGVFDLLAAPESMPREVDVALEDMPDISELPSIDAILYKFWPSLQRTGFAILYETEPPQEADWSALLWRVINICLEVGMSKEEVFAIAMTSKCNKYERDKRPVTYLWREVLKADVAHGRLNVLTSEFTPLAMPDLITPDEIANADTTIIDDYREWAVAATDAVESYHDLSCFMLLSTLCAAGLYCNVSYGKTIPNLWGLILGDSTLTRKTTAMRMAMEFVSEIDRDLVLATDGSAEGLLSGLSGRPNRVSVYFKDEVSGFFDSISRKDYLAGMPETMTQLYDVPAFYTRRLRKETVSLVSPVFIFFGGGIQERMYSLISQDYILSGFLPRFLVVGGDTDLKRIRRTGPATTEGDAARFRLFERFSKLYATYNFQNVIEIAGQQTEIPGTIEVRLTKEAWARYGEMEAQMVESAHDSPIAMLALPTFERLSRSLLKMAMLLSATRQEPTEGVITTTEDDLIHAARYIQDWGRYTVDLLLNSGRGSTQRAIEKVYRAIEKRPGILKSDIMRAHHFTKREMDEIVATLEDRLQVRATKEHRGQKLWPT